MEGKLICRKCTEEKPPGERFKVPANDFGEEQMKVHLWNEHRLNIDLNAPAIEDDR